MLQESPHHGGVVVQAGHVEGRDAVLSLLVTDRYTPGQELSGCYILSKLKAPKCKILKSLTLKKLEDAQPASESAFMLNPPKS